MRVVKTSVSTSGMGNLALIKSNPAPQQSRQAAAAHHRKIALPTLEGMQFERIQDILFLEAKGNYTSISFVNNRSILVCKTLRSVEVTLFESQFVRVHRSFTINMNRLEKYVRGKGGYVIMEEGKSISVSSGKKQDFMEALEVYFG